MAKELIRVEGLREIAVAARKLEDKVKTKIAVDAVLGGAKIVRNAARGLAPILKPRYNSDPCRAAGTLRRAIVAVRVRKGDFPEEVKAIVGVRLLSRGAIRKFRGSAGKAGAFNPRDPFYAAMVELGSRGHRKRRVAIPGVRYLKRGFEGNVRAATTEIRDIAARGILTYGNRLAR